MKARILLSVIIGLAIMPFTGASGAVPSGCAPVTNSSTDYNCIIPNDPLRPFNGRKYSLRHPGGSPGALLLGLHGAQQTPVQFNGDVPASAFGSGYIVAYPDGWEPSYPEQQWNDGRKKNKWGKPGDDLYPGDDAGFLIYLADMLRSHYALTKTYIFGHSNGGIMTMNMICNYNDRLKANAALVHSAALYTTLRNTCKASYRVPTLFIFSTDDRIMHEGLGSNPHADSKILRKKLGLLEKAPGEGILTNTMGGAPVSPSTVKSFCVNVPTTGTPVTGGKLHVGCTEGTNTVQYLELSNTGHGWYSGAIPLAVGFFDKPTRPILPLP